MCGGVVFINGYGTVGRWVAEVYSSLGFKVLTSKTKLDAGAFDAIRKGYDLYVIGDKQKFKDIEIPIAGTLDDLVNSQFSGVDLIIDCSPAGIGLKNKTSIYNNLTTPILYQGGEKLGIADNFVAAKNTISDKNFLNYKGKCARQVSCNTTSISIITGIISEVFGFESIDSIVVYLNRRSMDPHEEGKGIIDGIKQVVGSHHKDDLENVFPELADKISTIAAVSPMTHYHVLNLNFYMNDEISTNDMDLLIQSVKNNPSCVYLNGSKLSIPNIKQVCDRLGLPGYNTFLPLVQLSKLNCKIINVSIVVPQQSVVALSTGVWGLIALGTCNSFDEAISKVYSSFKINGMNIYDLKKNLETMLK